MLFLIAKLVLSVYFGIYSEENDGLLMIILLNIVKALYEFYDFANRSSKILILDG